MELLSRHGETLEFSCEQNWLRRTLRHGWLTPRLPAAAVVVLATDRFAVASRSTHPVVRVAAVFTQLVRVQRPGSGATGCA